MRVVVTGAAGFVGSHVCEELAARGHEVVGIDGFTPFYARGLKERNVAALGRVPAFTLRERNLLDRPGLADILQGADAICHLAGRPGVRGGAPVLFEAGNVRTTEAVMHSAARAGVRRVLLASSSSVYGPAARPVREDPPLRPLSPYARSKRRAELVASRLARRSCWPTPLPCSARRSAASPSCASGLPTRASRARRRRTSVASGASSGGCRARRSSWACAGRWSTARRWWRPSCSAGGAGSGPRAVPARQAPRAGSPS